MYDFLLQTCSSTSPSALRRVCRRTGPAAPSAHDSGRRNARPTSRTEPQAAKFSRISTEVMPILPSEKLSLQAAAAGTVWRKRIAAIVQYCTLGCSRVRVILLGRYVWVLFGDYFFAGAVVLGMCLRLDSNLLRIVGW